EPSVQQLAPEQIYQQYLQAYKKGVFNYIKEDADPSAQQSIPRKYFSGGTRLISGNFSTLQNTAQLAPAEFEQINSASFAMKVDLKAASPAMATPANKKFLNEAERLAWKMVHRYKNKSWQARSYYGSRVYDGLNGGFNSIIGFFTLAKGGQILV